MSDASTKPGRRVRALRADARRNQEQILAAARDLIIERGPGASLDEVARRAGVGIGTLYRRFPDRPALLRAVVLDALGRTREVAEKALAEEAEGFDALARYLGEALEARVSAVIPLVLDKLDLDDDQLGPAREASAAAIQRIVDAAHADGSLHPQVTFADIGTLLVRLSRPLPGPVPADIDAQLARRHLELMIRGLPRASDPALTGRGMNRAELRAARARYRPRPGPRGQAEGG